MSIDPSHYLPAANGGRPPLLKVQNISARPELNGRFGQAVSFSAGRYVVALLDAATAAAAAAGGAGPQPTMLKLKPENLAEAGFLDQMKFGAGMAAESAKAYASGPAAQEWSRRIADSLPPALRSRVTPQQALVGAAVSMFLLLVLVYYSLGRIVGFSKLFTLLTLVALILAVSSPDWMEGLRAGKPLPLIVRGAASNFVRRWRENIISATGYANVSERMALASLVLLLIFSGKVLLTPTPSGPPRRPDSPVAGGAQGPPPRPPQYDLEHIYKLGFEDATSGKEFGTSLPEDIAKYNAAQEEALPGTKEQYSDDENFEWAYNPPPPPPRRAGSGLGMGTLLSTFTLYRFGKDLATSPDGSVVFDLQYIAARLRTIEPWRLGILGMSLYRVVVALGSFVR
ncbi:hypothetical protein ACHAWF_003420 [Thalassiosira exigua]